MKIGIIGAGRMGGTLAVLLAHAGHQVFPANSRGVESLSALIAEAGKNAKAVTPEQAARDGELVIIALPWGHPEALPAPALVAGKIVVDAMNAFPSAGNGKITSSEQTAKALPGARLVKGFNTLNFKYMRDAAGLTDDKRLSLFVASDDDDAKRVVSGLMNDIGFAAIDTGSLHEGGLRQEPSGPIWNKRLTETKARAKLAA